MKDDKESVTANFNSVRLEHPAERDHDVNILTQHFFFSSSPSLCI